MENLSLKNIMWLIVSIPLGGFIGSVIGPIFGFLLWTPLRLIFGAFVYHSAYSIITNAFLSAALGVLLSLPIVAVARKLFGSSMSFSIWGAIGLVIGLIVMFSYGTYVISNPGIYGQDNSLIFSRRPQGVSYAELYYGAGTGQLIGASLYTLATLVITFQETLGKRRKLEDKKEFDEYTKFFESYLKK